MGKLIVGKALQHFESAKRSEGADARCRQVRRDPSTGLTKPEDRNPAQARGLLPLLDSDIVHRWVSAKPIRE